MRCSFIVSAFDRPIQLACLLRSLQAQTEPGFEVIVTDNDPCGGNFDTVFAVKDSRATYLRTKMRDCYESANYAASIATGDYLCFPSDDGYYAPRFLEKMLTAVPTDLIYCDCVYDGHGMDYIALQVSPQMNRIDKGGFLVKREKFIPFRGPFGVARAADGEMIESLMASGASSVKVPGLLWVHN